MLTKLRQKSIQEVVGVFRDRGDKGSKKARGLSDCSTTGSREARGATGVDVAVKLRVVEGWRKIDWHQQ